jgi:hypothetical protein
MKLGPSKPVECTTSKMAPVFDTLFAGLELVRTGVALSADDYDYRDFPISRGADIAFGVGFTGLFAASAGYGYATTSKCQSVKEQQRQGAVPEGATEQAEVHPKPRPLQKPRPKPVKKPVYVTGDGSTPNGVFIVGGATVGLAVGAGVTGALYFSKKAELDDLKNDSYATSQQRAETRRSVETLSTVNLLLTGGAILGAGVTSAIYFSKQSTNSSARLVPWVNGESAGAALSGSF